jgi:hypothetical protein
MICMSVAGYKLYFNIFTLHKSVFIFSSPSTSGTMSMGIVVLKVISAFFVTDFADLLCLHDLCGWRLIGKVFDCTSPGIACL